MSAKADFYARLQAHPPVAAAAAKRGTKPAVFMLRAPQGAKMPYAVVQRIGTAPQHHMGGACDLVNPQYQVACYAATAAELDALSEAVRDALDGWTGTEGDTSFRSVILDNETDDHAYPSDGSDSGDYSTVLTFEVWHRQPVPGL